MPLACVFIYGTRVYTRMSIVAKTEYMTDKKSKIAVAKKNQKALLPVSMEDVQDKIVPIRNQYVISDADIADLYGVETKRINEAVRNNPDKFPKDDMFILSPEELQDLRTKISTTKISAKSRTMPKVFTEKGLYMLATILKSPTAISVAFAIVETFAQVRYLKRELVALHQEKDSSRASERLKRFGEVISDIVMPDLQTSETESTLELNFFIGKLKHTVKRTKKEGK